MHDSIVRWMKLTSISRWTRTTCIAKSREARGRVARKMIGMGQRERNRVNCETGEGGFQILTLLRGFRDKIANFFTTPLSHNSQKRLEHKENQTKYRKMTRKPRSHVRNLIYRTFAVGSWDTLYISINNWKRILRVFNLKYTTLNCTSKITSGLQIWGQTKQSSSVKFKGVLHYKLDSQAWVVNKA